MRETKNNLPFHQSGWIQRNLAKIAPLIFLSILVLCVLFGFVMSRSIGDWPTRGYFGDMFGSINALFSGLAFGGIIIAILLQKQELEHQREELRLTREEIRGQKEQLQAQNETLRKQNFENTFFQMLGLHHEIVKAIDIQHPGWSGVKGDYSGVSETGRDAFVYLFNELKRKYTESQVSEGLEKVDREYEAIFANYQTHIGHYFRNLYNIIKFIDRKGPAQSEEKCVYTNLVRAQLSSHELLLLFYNCLSRFGREKFKPLIEKYHLLKNTPLNEILQPEHEAYYNPSAFKKPGTSQST